MPSFETLRKVLTPERLIELRRDGISYQEIADQVGYSQKWVRRYTQEVLAAAGLEQLQAKQPRREPRPKHHQDTLTAIHALLWCERCGLQGSARNPVDYASRRCLWCRLDQDGINLPKACQDGRYQAALETALEQEK